MAEKKANCPNGFLSPRPLCCNVAMIKADFFLAKDYCVKLKQIKRKQFVRVSLISVICWSLVTSSTYVSGNWQLFMIHLRPTQHSEQLFASNQLQCLKWQIQMLNNWLFIFIFLFKSKNSKISSKWLFCFSANSDTAQFLFLLRDHMTHCLWLILLFLAAMSSSRSDYVTHCVRLFVCSSFFWLSSLLDISRILCHSCKACEASEAYSTF